MENLKDLANDIRQKKVILFVGAGVSELLGSAPWDKLVDEMALELGYDRDVFKSMGNHLELAEFYKIRKKSIGALMNWMNVSWHNDNINIADSEVHKLIVNLDFPIIYTTNYDRWLEKAFDYYNKDYLKITTIDDMVNVKGDITQIIKFHGDLEDENSIVLTESSYFERLKFDTPLDIKLKGDVIGKSLLFIGYSLNDINMRYLLYRLNNLWECSKDKSCRPKSYLFLLNRNSVQQDILEERGIKTIVYEGNNKEEGIESFLKKLWQEVKL